MTIERFWASIEKQAIPLKEALFDEKVMEIISTIAYSSDDLTLADIDFNSFSLKHADRAMEHFYFFVPVEAQYEDDDNKGNLLLEINRIAHLKKQISKVEPYRKRKFF
ncbi:hypothetical protein ABEV55_18400 [Aneurinibacillus thermoaerophilus]|uniref:hypothetical protein n=1 Tax=Aneurinibacillus thermoaerophilus TaxID=143495 RepID=UPI002E1CCD75|nr:hypothetical protein [Aneurinibacillus thermoaerophilus]